MVRSLIQAHERVKSLEWQPEYVKQPDRYETKYHIPSKTKDPFRHLLRDFIAMEKEKDDRTYGSLLDVLARTDAANKADPTFTETIKAILPAALDGEYAAMSAMMMLGETVENAELRQGYLAQMLDEVRHVQAETWLERYYAKHYRDPAGFNVNAVCSEWHPLMMVVRAGFATVMSSDPIVNAVNLQVVSETAYTNPLFVALTTVAAQSGDSVTPSLFLSIQSDEGRHMANGYATLAAVLQDDRNIPFLETDLNDAFWRQHIIFDAMLGYVFDYQRDRSVETEPYRKYWDDWIWHDWAGSYIAKLEKFGLKSPACLEEVRRHVFWNGHTAAMLLHAIWPLNFWRQSVVPTEAFDWYERHYPGWYEVYGPFWEDAAEKADPANGTLVLEGFPEFPPLCRVCLTPCVYPRPDLTAAIFEEHRGRSHPFCSTICLGIFKRSPDEYLSYMNFGEKYNNWALADVITDMGLVREDGKTLIGQPHLNQERMWTIDDIRRIGYEIKYPF